MSGRTGSSISRFSRGSILLVLIFLFVCIVATGTADAATLSDTLIISADGSGCAAIGTWDAAGKTCLLTDDVTMTADVSALDVYGDGITVDGGGHKLTGLNSDPYSTATGVVVDGYDSVTVKNLDISGFHTGIRLLDSSFSIVVNNNVHDNLKTISGMEVCWVRNDLFGWRTVDLPFTDQVGVGIELTNSSNNYVSLNGVSGNGGAGVSLATSSFNVISGNTVSGNNAFHSHCMCPGSAEVDPGWVPGPPVESTVGDGIRLTDSSFCTVNNNSVSGHEGSGINLKTSDFSGVSNNTMSGNALGLMLDSNGATGIRHNNFVGNEVQAGALSNAETFSGNYFDDWSGSGPYVFLGGTDGAPGSAPITATSGRLALTLRMTSATWGSYAGYLARQLYVTYVVINEGDNTAYGFIARDTSASQSVNPELWQPQRPLTDTPPAGTDLAAGSSAPFWAYYHIPAGVTAFRTTVKATAQDESGLTYYYP